MSLFGASRFTAMLAAIAILGTAGSLWWAVATRADLKSHGSGRSADRVSPSKFASRVLRLKDERANKFASTVTGERAQSTSPGWSDDPDQRRGRLVAPRTFAENSELGLRNRGADMPIPAPPMALSDPGSRQANDPVPQVIASQSPAENQRQLARDPKPERAAAAMPYSARQAARPYYIEKVVEQGDAGEATFRYRYQSCEPPNMPDVCFMPRENRRSIVMERR